MISNQARYLLKCARHLAKQAGPFDWLRNRRSGPTSSAGAAGSAPASPPGALLDDYVNEQKDVDTLWPNLGENTADNVNQIRQTPQALAESNALYPNLKNLNTTNYPPPNPFEDVPSPMTSMPVTSATSDDLYPNLKNINSQVFDPNIEHEEPAARAQADRRLRDNRVAEGRNPGWRGGNTPAPASYQLPERDATQQLVQPQPTNVAPAQQPVQQQPPNVKTSEAHAASLLLKCAGFLVKQAAPPATQLTPEELEAQTRGSFGKDLAYLAESAAPGGAVSRERNFLSPANTSPMNHRDYTIKNRMSGAPWAGSGAGAQFAMMRALKSRDSRVRQPAYAAAQEDPRFKHQLENYNYDTASHNQPAAANVAQPVAKPISNPGWQGGNTAAAPPATQLPARGATQQPVRQQPASSFYNTPSAPSPLQVAPPDEKVHFETAEVIPNPPVTADTTVKSRITPNKRLKSGAAAAVNLLKCASFLVKQAH